MEEASSVEIQVPIEEPSEVPAELLEVPITVEDEPDWDGDEEVEPSGVPSLEPSSSRRGYTTRERWPLRSVRTTPKARPRTVQVLRPLIILFIAGPSALVRISGSFASGWTGGSQIASWRTLSLLGLPSHVGSNKGL